MLCGGAVHNARIELNCSKSTRLHDTFFGHAHPLRYLIGCSETSMVSAQSL